MGWSPVFCLQSPWSEAVKVGGTEVQRLVYGFCFFSALLS